MTSLRKASPGGSLRRLRDTDPLLQDSGRRSKRKERGRSEMAEMKSFVSFDRKDKVEKKLNRSHRTKNSLVMLHSESASSQSPRHHRYHWKNGPAAVEHVKEDHDGQDNDPSVPNVLTEVQETGTTCTLTSAACPLLPSFTAFDGIETLRNSAENDNIPGKQPRAVKKCREGTFFTGIVSNKSRRNSLEVQVPGDHLGNLADVGFWPLSPVSISVTGVNSLQWSEYSWYKKCPAPSLV